MAVEKKISEVELLDSISNDLNFITEVNGEWKRLNGNVLYNNIFIAEYEVTTPDELVKAYREGKEIILKLNEENHKSHCYGRISYINGLAALNDAKNHPKPACVIHFIATTRKNGAEEMGYRCSCNYADTSNGINIGWAQEDTGLVKVLRSHRTDITNLMQQVNNISKTIPSFQAEPLLANSKFKITKTGLYLFAGADYNLKLRGASNSDIGGHDNNLLIAVFVSHVGAQGYGNYHAFVGKTYKSTLTTSAESKNIYWEDTLSENLCPYVENTDNVNSAMVYYLT